MSGGADVFKNRGENGTNNLCGRQIAALRRSHVPKLSQRALAEQLYGMDIDKNAVQRIESGARFVTDIELKIFAEFFQVSADELLS